jgi:hypothetical protein
MANGKTAAPSGQMTPQQINALQRQTVLRNSVEMTQQVASTTIAAPTAGNNVVNFAPRNVGLVKRFILEITGTATAVTSAGSSTVYGLSKLISNLQFTDLNNNVRINTDGVHLSVLKQVKNREIALSAQPITTIQTDAMLAGQFVASAGSPNFPVINYPPAPATGGSAFRAVFEIPLAYSDEDLRGAIYFNVVNATAQLSITLNANAFSGTSATDTTPNAWSSGANAQGAITAVTLTLYQVYLDQLPVGQNGVILPTLDLSTVYELKQTSLTGQVVSLDFPYPYANFRDFLSTLVTWNSTGATAGLKNGSDVNYWSLQSANFTNIWKIDPLLAAQKTREIIGADLPLGTYYFSHRKKPLSTVQYGNLQLNLNAASLTAGSCYEVVYVEDFALVNALTQAGSLAG